MNLEEQEDGGNLGTGHLGEENGGLVYSLDRRRVLGTQTKVIGQVESM